MGRKPLDLKDQPFGQLIAREYSSGKWLCDCSCGKTHTATASNLRSGNTSSCGCLVSVPTNFLNLAGKTLGPFEVIDYDKQAAKWNCICKHCRRNTQIAPDPLRSLAYKSCGCLRYKLVADAHWSGVGDLSGRYFSGLRWGAKKRKLVFRVTSLQLWELFQRQSGLCALSGLQMSLKKPQTASLDRKNSLKGYTLSNVQWVHKDLNRMKSDFGLTYFLDLCQRVLDTNNAKTSVRSGQ